MANCTTIQQDIDALPEVPSPFVSRNDLDTEAFLNERILWDGAMLERAEAKIALLVRALREFGSHQHHNCHGGIGKCTCGLDAVLKAVQRLILDGEKP